MERPKRLEVVEPYKLLLGILGVGLAFAGPFWLFFFLPTLFWGLGWGVHWIIYGVVEYG